MEWIDEANKQRAAITAREKSIVEHEDATYEALWAELKLHIDAAKEKGFPRVRTNGRDLARVVILPPDPMYGDPDDDSNSLDITLTKGSHEITASGGFFGHAVIFQIDVCADGFVCLKFEGKQISNKEAAIRILWPFLYPDLPAYAGPKPTLEVRASMTPRLKIPRTGI